MNPSFDQRLQELDAETRDLFFHKLRSCPVEEAFDVLLFARLDVTMAEVLACKEIALRWGVGGSEPMPTTPPASLTADPNLNAAPAPSTGLTHPYEPIRGDTHQYEPIPLMKTQPDPQLAVAEPLPNEQPASANGYHAPAQPNRLSALLNAPNPADTALTLAGQNPPAAPEPTLLAPVSALVPQLHRKPRNGKIARLPKPVRDVVNRMLASNIPQQKIVGALEELGIRVTQHNISNWKIHGGYREWCLAQEHAVRLRLHQDNLVDLVRRNDGSELSESGLQMAATHLSQFFHTPEAQKLLASDPKEYQRRVTMLTRVSAELKGLQQYRDDCARRLGPLNNPTRIRKDTAAELEKLRYDWSCVSGQSPKDRDKPHHNDLPDPTELYHLESTEKPKTIFPSLEELVELERRRAARTPAASPEPTTTPTNA